MTDDWRKKRSSDLATTTLVVGGGRGRTNARLEPVQHVVQPAGVRCSGLDSVRYISCDPGKSGKSLPRCFRQFSVFFGKPSCSGERLLCFCFCHTPEQAEATLLTRWFNECERPAGFSGRSDASRDPIQN
ncbi:MAG: hypothetical protein EBR82_87765, partial [Caulobacteraceae bacterium]|nr:hypothetical protein [Caulobacteraceae bacterium]